MFCYVILAFFQLPTTCPSCVLCSFSLMQADIPRRKNACSVLQYSLELSRTLDIIELQKRKCLVLVKSVQNEISQLFTSLISSSLGNMN